MKYRDYNYWIKDSIKLLMLRTPQRLLCPIVSLLWHVGAINRHYYILSKIGFPDRVLQGPFKQMKYVPSSVGSAIVPKYLGTYEKELWSAIETICANPCDILVNVGSAEGYYAIGLTLRLMPKMTHCFDIDSRANRLLMKIARLNGVNETIHTHYGCSLPTLENVLCKAVAPVLIMDCEGCEDELLQPQFVPSLAKTRILLELHDSAKPDIDRRIEQRFHPIHKIETVQSVERSTSDLPPNLTLTTEEAIFGMNEDRMHTMKWFLMTPRK